MSISYTYWPAKEGGYIGYWNDYPDYWTEAGTVPELEDMLRSLRDDINAMIADGTMTDAPRSIGAMELA
jgi:predicted RNase H-like HicB family nuclease